MELATIDQTGATVHLEPADCAFLARVCDVALDAFTGTLSSGWE